MLQTDQIVSLTINFNICTLKYIIMNRLPLRSVLSLRLLWLMSWHVSSLTEMMQNRLYFDYQHGKLYQIASLHLLFSDTEWAVWSNMISWMSVHELSLSESAEWWPVDYDYTKYSWEAAENERAAQKAYVMMLRPADELLNNLSHLWPSTTKLIMMIDEVKDAGTLMYSDT